MKRFANKSKYSPIYALLQFPGITIQKIDVNTPEIIITAQIKNKYGICPECGKWSKNIHSKYCRRVQDLPISTNSVIIRLFSRKFFCRNSRCKRKIFSQQLPLGLNQYARRTTRVTDQLTRIGLEVSARKCSLFSKRLNLPSSPSTCLRLVNHCSIPVNKDVRHIGIDDWAYRKGHSYGTILVDRETGKPIDLIRSRDKGDIIEWLKVHPYIKTVTRDRAECYSQSISSVIPDAIQIADRFHLVVNFSDSISGIVKKLLPVLKKTRLSNSAHSSNSGNEEIQRIIDQAYGGQDVLDDHKKDLIRKAKELHRQGYSKNRIADIMQMNFRTIQKYIDQPMNHISLGRTPRVDYTRYLDDLISGYCCGEKLSVIYRKIQKKGFKGTREGLSYRFGVIYKEGKRKNREIILQKMKRNYCPRTIAPRKLTIYLTNRNFKKILSPDEIELFQKIKAENPLVHELWDISEEFRNIFENKPIPEFQKWIERIGNSSFHGLKSFVKGLIKDFEAIKAAIIYDDNNGLTEGNVNRLKNIKRQMYGRASFELLRKKVVLSCTG